MSEDSWGDSLDESRLRELEAEVERLTREIASAGSIARVNARQCEIIDRLTRVAKDLNELLVERNLEISGLRAERDELLRGVNEDEGYERLRAALERIATDEAPHDHGMWFHEMARDALEGGPSERTEDTIER